MSAAGPRRSALTARDREICAAIGPLLREKGQVFVGIDVIGDWLTEINVTSPTGLQELERFDGTNAAGGSGRRSRRGGRMSWQLGLLNRHAAMGREAGAGAPTDPTGCGACFERRGADPFPWPPLGRVDLARRSGAVCRCNGCRRTTPAQGPVILYLHGGGLCLRARPLRIRRCWRRSRRLTGRGRLSARLPAGAGASVSRAVRGCAAPVDALVAAGPRPRRSARRRQRGRRAGAGAACTASCGRVLSGRRGFLPFRPGPI